MDLSLRGHPPPSPPPPHVSRLLLVLKSGICGRNCIFISLTSGSIVGFSSPAAAVARLTSEQLNLGQPLTSWHWWPGPVLEGRCLLQEWILFSISVVGQGERVLTHWLLALRLPVQGGISPFRGTELPRSPGYLHLQAVLEFT